MSGRDTPLEELAPGAILARASERARQLGVGYSGAVTPTEAYELREAGEAAIVDVRTVEEWREVGHVPGAPLVVWPREGDPQALQQFLEQVREFFEPAERLLLICRSGIRSHHAAELLTRAGYRECCNVLEGFEGDYGARANGWRAAGLPWKRG